MRKQRWTLFIALLLLFSLPSPVHATTWNSPVQLTSDSTTHAQARVSLDGTKVTYIANPPPSRQWQIFVMSSDGTGMRQLTDNAASNLVPSINGNGSLIVFYSNLDGNYEIYKVKSDGTGLTPLTSTTGVVNTYPVISSDGSRIAFQSNRIGNLELYSVFSDGSGLTQVTSNNVTDEHASVSFDGKKIAFDSRQAGKGQVFVVNSDGTGLRQITFNSANNVAPVISGDGRYVALQSNSTGHHEIWLADTDGSGLRQLTFEAGEDTIPSINYDGSLVAFQGSVNGFIQIKVAQTASGQIDQLTFDQANHYLPSIDGPGVNVVYQADAGGFTQLYRVDRVNYDLAVTGLSASRDFAYTGIIAQPIRVNATVVNFSPVSETFDLTARANSTLIGTKTVTGASKGTLTVTFYWNTTLVPRGTYTLSGQASQVQGEIDLNNNVLSMTGIFQVRKAGDVNGDGAVDIDDLVAVYVHMFTTSMPSYYDLDNDGDVDIDDLVTTWLHQFV